MKRRCSVPINRGFTVVELLVVIGIIALLIGILTPVLGKVRDRANEVKCATNLRALGQGLAIYTQDYRYYPAYAGQASAIAWIVRIRNVLGGNQSVFNCPSQDPRCEWKLGENHWLNVASAEDVKLGYRPGEPRPSDGTTGEFFGYGYNAWGADVGIRGLGNGGATIVILEANEAMQMPSSRVKKPTEMIAITDSTADGLADFAVWAQQFHPAAWPGRVHHGGANVLFCDGHVLWYRQEDLVLRDGMTVQDQARIHRMWDYDQGKSLGY